MVEKHQSWAFLFPYQEMNRPQYSNTYPIIFLTQLDATQLPACISRGETEKSENTHLKKSGFCEKPDF